MTVVHNPPFSSKLKQYAQLVDSRINERVAKYVMNWDAELDQRGRLCLRTDFERGGYYSQTPVGFDAVSNSEDWKQVNARLQMNCKMEKFAGLLSLSEIYCPNESLARRRCIAAILS